jgi:hypothetical protein
MDTLPRNAPAFVAFMESVWDADPHGLYDQLHDAMVAAKRCGMIRTGGTRVDGEDWHVFRFPQASDGVCINRDGSSLQLTSRRFGRKKAPH